MIQVPVQPNNVAQQTNTQPVDQQIQQPTTVQPQVQQTMPVDQTQVQPQKTLIQKFRDSGFSTEDIQTYYKDKIQSNFLDNGFSGSDINQFLKSKGYNDDDIKEMTSKLSPYDRAQIRGDFDSLKPTIQAAFKDADTGEMDSYLENVIGVRDKTERQNLIKEFAPETGKDFNTIRKEAREKFKGDTKKETQYIRTELAKSKGQPTDSWEAFRRFFIRPANEAAQKISVGARSTAVDAYNLVGNTSIDTNEALDLERKEVAWREKTFKEKYGTEINIPKKVVEALPEAAAMIAGGGLGTIATSAFALGYGHARSEGKDKTDALMQGTVAAALPGALFGLKHGGKVLEYTPMGLFMKVVNKGLNKIMNTPEVNKELIKAFNMQAKADKLDTLKFADKEGISLALPQLVDNKVIDQLTTIMSRTSAVRNIFQKAIDEGALKTQAAWTKRIESLSDKDVSTTGSSINLGSSVSDTFKKAQQARKDEYTTAYNKFKELGDKEFFSDSMKFDLKNSLEKMKQSSDTTNDSKSIRAFANQLLNKIDEAKTITDLDLIRKKAAEEIRKPGLKEVYRSYIKNMHETIDNSLANHASEDAYKLLKQARGLVAQERNIYGKQSSYNTIKNAVSDSSYKSDIVKNFLSGSRAVENIRLLKQEAERVGDDTILKDLLKRYVEVSQPRTIEPVRGVTKANMDDLLKTYSRLDKSIIKELGGSELASDLSKLASIAKSFKEFEGLTKTTPQTGQVAPMKYLGEMAASYIRGRPIAKLLTNPVFMKTAIAMGESPRGTSELLNLTKQASKKLGLDLSKINLAPVNEGTKSHKITIYKTGSNEYSTKEPSNKRGKKPAEQEVYMSDLASKEDLDKIAKLAGKKNLNIKDKRTINELKGRDFKGYIHNGKVVLFD